MKKSEIVRVMSSIAMLTVKGWAFLLGFSRPNPTLFFLAPTLLGLRHNDSLRSKQLGVLHPVNQYSYIWVCHSESYGTKRANTALMKMHSLVWRSLAHEIKRPSSMLAVLCRLATPTAQHWSSKTHIFYVSQEHTFGTSSSRPSQK